MVIVLNPEAGDTDVEDDRAKEPLVAQLMTERRPLAEVLGRTL